MPVRKILFRFKPNYTFICQSVMKDVFLCENVLLKQYIHIEEIHWN